jgi:hypothetical protein
MITSQPSWTNGYPEPAIQIRGLLPFAALTSGFAFMSFAAHAIVLLDFERYKANLREGLNVHRWYEYSVSSSLMIVLIAMLFGVTDAMSLTTMAGCNASMCLFGLLHERMNAGVLPAKVNWEPFWFGCFAGVIPWAVIFAYIGSSPSVAKVPGFVWGILVAYAFFFNTFPINMYLQYKRWGYWSDEKAGGFPGAGYLFGERMYQVQSLVSKSLLLWLVIGGTNQPSPSTGRTTG